LKANSNPHLVQNMKKALPSLSADCSSPGEIFVAQKAGIHMFKYKDTSESHTIWLQRTLYGSLILAFATAFVSTII